MSTTKTTKPTAEEIRQQQVRALIQRRESFAQGILFNALHNPALDPMKVAPADMARWSVEVAEALMDALYGGKKKDKPEEGK